MLVVRDRNDLVYIGLADSVRYRLEIGAAFVDDGARLYKMNGALFERIVDTTDAREDDALRPLGAARGAVERLADEQDERCAFAATEDLVAARRLRDALRDGAEHLIASGVSVRFVQLGELVDLDHEEAQRGVVTPRMCGLGLH